MKTSPASGRLAAALLALIFSTAASSGAARTAHSADDALSLVPSDASSVAVVRLSELRSSPLSGRLFANADNIASDGDAARFLEQAGLRPKEDVDTVVVAAMPRSGSGENAVLAMFEGRFDPDRLAAAAVARGAVRKTTPAGDYYLLPEKSEKGKPGAAAFASRRLVIAGSEAAVVQALADREGGGAGFAGGAGALSRQLARIDRGASAWALVDVARSSFPRNEGSHVRIHSHGESESGEPALALLGAMKSISAFALQATARGDALELSLTGLCSDADTRQLIEDSVRGVLAMWRLSAQEKSPDLVSALRKFTIKSDSEGVSIKGTLPGSFLRAQVNKSESKRSEQR